MKRLKGKTAIITGGASGIGAASVRLFAEEGARVLIADAQTERGEALAKELGDAALFQRVDVTREEEVRSAVDEVMKRWGRLDCIYNNAGFGGALGSIETTTVEEFDITFDVLLKGVFLGIKHAAPAMRASGGGSIISTASVAGLKTGESPHLYSVAKAAVIHLTRSVALELGEHNIRVNCICPGIVATPLAAGRASASDESLQKLAKGLARTQAMGRVGQPEDIARAALWLASDESEWVTGHAQVVDGGAYAGRPWSRQGEWITADRPIKLYRPEGR
ncbi:MAG: glucose 1-dehydrogenase [Myxococcales bacterium]|nr:glucose 1-dehydrogenase [Myxococcales bacterium]HIM02375.1 glucose 1-dehydrogenase [Myxococcales bacterium]